MSLYSGEDGKVWAGELRKVPSLEFWCRRVHDRAGLPSKEPYLQRQCLLSLGHW